VFTSKLLYHSLKVGISSFELILNQVGTLLEIIADVAHFFPQLIVKRRTDTNDHELIAQAWQAANDKAREFGWIV
jgi:hypothetical protein